MRRASIAFAVCALLAFARLASADTVHVSKSFQVGPNASLRLNSFSGRVHITAGDGDTVTVNAVRTGSADQLAHVHLEMRQEGSSVIVEANQRDDTWFSWWRRNQVVDTDFDVTVPHRTDVDVHVFSSPVEIAGVEGEHRVHTFSSPVRLDDVAGRLSVHTFSGSVDVRATSWREPARIEVDTFSGRVELRVPESAHGRAEFHSFSGELRSALPLLLRSSSRRNVTAELTGSGPAGEIRVKTFSGDLRIDR